MSKVFLDTCIWFELVAGANPVSSYQVNQSQKASLLLNELLQNKTPIVVLDIQLIELTQTIMKAKFRECNRNLKNSGLPGVERFKDFRSEERCRQYYSQALIVCTHAINDIKNLSQEIVVYHSNIDSILENMAKADINDCIYYEYCKKNGMILYTFDSDFENFNYEHLNVIDLN